MLDVSLQVLRHGEGLDHPLYATAGSAGCDLRAAITESLSLEPGQIVLVPTGFRMALPLGYEAQIRPRSGLAIRHGVTVANAPGTIDSDYRGEVKVGLINLGQEPFVIDRGTRVAQMVVAQVTRANWRFVSELDNTDRGAGGFGSTGTG
ncbi:MAG: dUTP diphosphatase [Proteobacteria bacterium]|jgi:dUTP pyrophosphatase|nr:dUTP diphosphatase [Pseudomonadota bacterium]